MYSEGGIEAEAARVSASSKSAFPASVVASLPASIRAPRAATWLLLAEAGAFVLAAASGKIPAFLFMAVRALLTF